MENSKGHTILLVDDEPDILEFLSYNIRKEGYKVFRTNNGEEGVKLAQQLSPSLILLDVMMPKMDGIETCQIIRKDLNITQPIIAFLTSRAIFSHIPLSFKKCCPRCFFGLTNILFKFFNYR